MSFWDDIAKKILKYTDYGRFNGIGYETNADRGKEVRKKVKELDSKAIDLVNRQHETESRIDSSLNARMNDLEELDKIGQQQEELKNFLEKQNEQEDVKELKYLPKDEE